MMDLAVMDIQIHIVTQITPTIEKAVQIIQINLTQVLMKILVIKKDQLKNNLTEAIQIKKKLKVQLNKS